jgi:hypothetical protein
MGIGLVSDAQKPNKSAWLLGQLPFFGQPFRLPDAACQKLASLRRNYPDTETAGLKILGYT